MLSPDVLRNQAREYYETNSARTAPRLQASTGTLASPRSCVSRSSPICGRTSLMPACSTMAAAMARWRRTSEPRAPRALSRFRCQRFNGGGGACAPGGPA